MGTFVGVMRVVNKEYVERITIKPKFTSFSTFKHSLQ